MEHVENKSLISLKLKASSIDKDILQVFWTLAEGNDDSRVVAISQLVAKLLHKQKEDGAGSELKYVLERLVKGLASSRKFARLGYSMALTQILRDFDAVTVDDVLQTSEKCLVLRQHLTKSEAGNVSMGKAFTCLTLIQSGRLFQGSKTQVHKVVKQLKHLQREKTYLHPICIRALSLIIAKVNEKVFEKHVYPQLEEQLSKGWESATPDDILLLNACCQHQKESVDKEFIKKHWGHYPLICEKHYEHISRVLMDSTFNYPLVHEVTYLVVQQVTTQELDLQTFWSQVVRKLFMENVKRQHLGLTIFSKLLPYIHTDNEMSAIFSPDVVFCLMKHIGHKGDPLNVCCNQVVSELIEHLKSSLDGEIQIAVFRSLICKPSSPSTFGATRQNLLSTVIMSFSEETIREVISFLMAHIIGKKSERFPVEGDYSVWACSQLNNLLRLGKVTNLDLRVSVIRFLCLHGFFTIKTLSNSLMHCDVQPASDNHAAVCSSSFSKYLARMATVHPEKATKTEKFEIYLRLVYDIIQYADKLMKSPDVVSMRNPFTEDIQEAWEKVLGIVNNIEHDRKGKSVGVVGLKEAFELLYIFLGLQMFTEPDSVIPILEDVHVCYNKAFQKRRKSMSKSSVDPHWMEVVTEVLVSLLSQNSNLTRVVTRTVFKALADHTTRDSLAVIVKAVQPKKGKDSDDDEEEDMLSFEEDEGEANTDSMDVDSVDKDNDENDDNDDDDDEEEEEEEVDEDSDEEVVDDSFRQTVQAALGDAGEEDSEGEDLPDFTDEQMFELDDKLAEVFRSLRKGRSKEEKEKKQQIVTFKTRVLDMVAILAKNPPSVAVSVDLLQAVLQVMEKGDRLQEEQVLYNKSRECFTDLCHHKKMADDGGVDAQNLFVVFQSLIQYSRKVTSMKMVKHISDACLFVISLLLNTASGGKTDPSPVKTRSGSHKAQPKQQKDYHSAVVDIVQTSLADLLYKKDHRLHMLFFHNMIDKHPKMFWPLSGTLMQVLQDETVKLHSRTQACSLLTALMNTSCVKELDVDVWRTFADQLTVILKQLIVELNVEKPKPMLVRELFTLMLKLFNLYKDATQKICTAEVREKLAVLKAKMDTDTRRIFNKIHIHFPKEEANGEESNETKKKKKSEKHGKKKNKFSDSQPSPAKVKKSS